MSVQWRTQLTQQDNENYNHTNNMPENYNRPLRPNSTIPGQEKNTPPQNRRRGGLTRRESAQRVLNRPGVVTRGIDLTTHAERAPRASSPPRTSQIPRQIPNTGRRTTLPVRSQTTSQIPRQIPNTGRRTMLPTGSQGGPPSGGQMQSVARRGPTQIARRGSGQLVGRVATAAVRGGISGAVRGVVGGPKGVAAGLLIGSTAAAAIEGVSRARSNNTPTPQTNTRSRGHESFTGSGPRRNMPTPPSQNTSTTQTQTRTEGSSFGQAFSQARSSGKSEFTWQGKQYNTRTKEDDRALIDRGNQRAARIDRIASQESAAGLGAGNRPTSLRSTPTQGTKPRIKRP